MPDHMSKAEADAMLARADAATPGPWYCQGELTDEECGRAGGAPPAVVIETDNDGGVATVLESGDIQHSEPDCEFAAAARADIPALHAALSEAMAMVCEVAGSGVAMEDERLRYLDVQIHRDDLAAMRVIATAWRGDGEGGKG